MRRTLVALAAAAMLSMPMMAGSSTALAANQNQGDGLVAVQVGDVTLYDLIDVNAAVGVVASLCDTNVNVAVLAAVDATGKKATICKTASRPRDGASEQVAFTP